MFCLTNCKELAQGYPTPWQWGSLVRVSVEAHFFLVGASVESQFGDDTVLALTGCGFPSPVFSQYVKKKTAIIRIHERKKTHKKGACRWTSRHRQRGEKKTKVVILLEGAQNGFLNFTFLEKQPMGWFTNVKPWRKLSPNEKPYDFGVGGWC